MKQLNERSLRPMALKDLIYDIVSVDEYTPKIADTNIVVAFQVLDNFDAAYDLGSFLERCPLDIIDTEASETPNVDGRYSVFVEYDRDAQFPQRLLETLKIIQNVCPDPGWKLQIYGQNDPMDVDLKAMTDVMNLVIEEELKEFFDFAPVSVDVLKESVCIESVYGSTLHYSLSSGTISEKFVKSLLESDTSLECQQLSAVLGENYDVLRSGSEYVIGRNGKYVLLR